MPWETKKFRWLAIFALLSGNEPTVSLRYVCIQVLQFSSYKSYTYFLKFMCKYFIFGNDNVNGIVFNFKFHLFIADI